MNGRVEDLCCDYCCRTLLSEIVSLATISTFIPTGSSQLPSENFLRIFPYHLPPLRKFRNVGRIENTVVLNFHVTNWVALGFRWTRMEVTCREIGLEPSHDSLPGQPYFKSMHGGSVSYSKATFFRRRYTLRCVSRMRVSSVG